jgi:hypothetical protein
VQRALATIWEGIARHPPIGVDDDFFALGGLLCLAPAFLPAYGVTSR